MVKIMISDEELIIIEKMLVEDLNMPSLETRIMIYLLENKRATSKEICSRFGIQQPVASMTTKKMIGQGLLVVEKMKLHDGRGRRSNVYRLAGKTVAVFNRFLKKKVDEVRTQEQAIAKVLLMLRKVT